MAMFVSNTNQKTKLTPPRKKYIVGLAGKENITDGQEWPKCHFSRQR